MGLDFSHCDAHWSYSGFMRFRIKLAKEIGMDLEKMEGFTSGGIPWDKFKDDIVPLLDHSDCEGHLTPRELKFVAPRLRELVSRWDDGDYDKNQALELARGMELALEEKKSLRFT